LWFFAFWVRKDVGTEPRVDIVLFIIRVDSWRGLLLDILHLPFHSMNMLVFLSIRNGFDEGNLLNMPVELVYDCQ
jgi:hypothetical protein